MGLFISLLVTLVTLSLALPAAADPPAELKSEEDKVVYSLGVVMGRGLGVFDLSERELAVFNRGLEDAVFARPVALELTEYAPKINELAARRKALVGEKEREASKPFLAQAAAAPGAVKTDSGLIYVETKAGTGASPGPKDRVKVHYHGTLRDGTVFDSSRDRGEPAIFSLNRVISCWREALQMMKVGGQAAIVCPADIAYGNEVAGKWGAIRPGSALRFEVELISIE